MVKKVSENKGFTLIEVLIALMIILTIVGAIITIFIENVYIKNRSRSYYDIAKVAQSIIEDIKTCVLIVDGKEEEVFSKEVEKTLNFIKDGYYSEVLIKKIYPNREIYQIVVKVKDTIGDSEYILYTRIYHSNQDSIYEKVYYELPILL